tara:strand:+ start:41 stop:496 length:456 start_codon:yes stop_codon:yes gene_type:complete
LKSIILTLFFIFSSITPTYAQVSYKADNIEAYELYEELRCLVCQNQSLLDSDAPLALDLKKLVLDKLEEGKSKEEIKLFLVERYGEFILLKPTFTIKNILLWVGPLIFVIFGFFTTFIFLRKNPLIKEENVNLTNIEKDKLKKIIDRELKE